MMENMFWWFVLLIVPIQGSHFDGGTIYWAPVNKNATTSPIQVAITQSYTYTLSSIICSLGSIIGSTSYGYDFNLSCTLNCGTTSAGYVAPPVLGYCTGWNSLLNNGFAQRTDIVNLDVNDYFSVSYSIPAAASLGFYRALTTADGNTTLVQWNITASIDIRSRSDNGLINTPPLAGIMSPYGIPYDISTEIVIPTLDIDGDDVRCRWSNSSLECGGACFPTVIPASTTLSKDCIITITGIDFQGWYCASIQVEDFLNTSTTLPAMSSIPLQFLIYVYMTRNCSIPTLSSPSTCVGVQVGVPYTTILTAINQCGASANISDIAVQSFPGVVKGSLLGIDPINHTTYVMNITYTPLASQVGLQILCTTAFDDDNIPSAQYCITFIVGIMMTPVCPGDLAITLMVASKPNSVDWALIGALIGLITLCALVFCCCCCCYYCCWGAEARRRRRCRKSKKEHHYLPMNDSANDSFDHPPKTYQVYDIDTRRSGSSPVHHNHSKKYQLAIRTFTSSSNRIHAAPSHLGQRSVEQSVNVTHITRQELPRKAGNDTFVQRRNAISAGPLVSTHEHCPLKRAVKSAVSVVRLRRTQKSPRVRTIVVSARSSSRSTVRNEQITAKDRIRRKSSVTVSRVPRAKRPRSLAAAPRSCSNAHTAHSLT